MLIYFFCDEKLQNIMTLKCRYLASASVRIKIYNYLTI